VGANLIIVRIDAPPEVVYQRLEQRAKGMNPGDNSEADWRVYRRMKPTAQRIRRNHFAVDTSKDITPVIDKIVRRINQ
jgi:predicted kinase